MNRGNNTYADIADSLFDENINEKSIDYTKLDLTPVFDIPNPVMLLSVYDEAVRDNIIQLYPWQTQTHIQYASIYQNPRRVNRISIRANNGSGKSTYLMAPCAVFTGMRYREASTVITSASGAQLDRQTGRAINRLVDSINEFHGEKIWERKYRHYENLISKSIIQLFATDQPELAEGYHPIKPGGVFTLLVDEAKSVPQSIFEALSRCNGVIVRMDVSSPGPPRGHFYQTQVAHNWWRKHVTWKDTPHVTQDEYDEAVSQYGENSPIVKSMFWAEFTSIDECVCITYENLTRLINNKPDRIDFGYGKFAGLDLAAGGDECVLAAFDENEMIGLECFRYSFTPDSVKHIKGLLRKYDISPQNVFADDGGVGKGIIDQLWEAGYRVNRVINQAQAFNKQAYGNRGAEMYFNFARYVEELDIILKPDKTLINQLSNRYYETKDKSKLFLESKVKARANGHPSPDRSDAVVLAFADKPYGSWKRKNLSAKKINEQTAQTRKMTIPTTEELLELHSNRRIQNMNRKSMYISDKYGIDTLKTINSSLALAKYNLNSR